MQCGLNGAPGRKPRSPKEKASAFRRWLVTRAYSPHPEPPVLRVEAIFGKKVCRKYGSDASDDAGDDAVLFTGDV